MSCAVVGASSPVFSPRSSPLLVRAVSSPKYLTIIREPLEDSSCLSSPLKLSFKHQINGTIDMKKNESSSSHSKRKRPEKLDIPISFLDFETSNTMPDVKEQEEIEFSVVSKKGKRHCMEDRFIATVNLQGDKRNAFFGVFDGHGGAKAAEFASENMTQNVMDEILEEKEGRIEEAISRAYLRTDSEFLKEEQAGGSCCVTALIRNGSLIVSHAGDCRAVMSRAGIAEVLTIDHKPSRREERERIEKLGGFVDCINGVWRLHGTLAVTRSIGDGHLKKWVTAEPDTTILRLESDCEFLIIASDGLWDKVDNQEAVDITRSFCTSDYSSPLTACRNLTELSIQRGSLDDITVMIIMLKHFI